MMRTAAVAACLLAATLLGGCSSTPPEALPTSSEPSSSATGQLLVAAPSQEVDVSTVFQLDAQAAPGGALTSFLLTIPAGAVQREEFTPTFAIERLTIGFVPLNPEAFPTGLESFGLLVFKLSDSDADLASAYTRGTTVGSTGLGPLLTPINEKATLSGQYLTLSTGLLQDGDRIAIVIAADAEKAPLRLAVRFMNRTVEFSEDPPQTLSDLRQPGGAVVVLPAYASGTGFQVAQYTQITSLFAFTGEATSGAVQVQDALPRQDIAATVRDVIVSAPGFDSGYSYATGAYLGYEAHGLWSAAGELHGTPVNARSIIAQDFALSTGVIAELLLLGLPVYTFIGDGAGPSDLAFHVQVANINEFQILQYAKLDFGMTGEQLTGKPGLEGGAAALGLAGNLPPTLLLRESDTLVMVDGAGRVFSSPLPGT